MTDTIQALRSALEGQDDDLLLGQAKKAVEDGCNTDSAHVILNGDEAHIERLKVKDGNLYALAEVPNYSSDPDADDFIWKYVRICKGMDGDFGATVRSIAEALIKDNK